MKGINSTHREAIKILSTRKEFPAFMEFLRVQRDNIAILEWARVKSTDPNIALIKANYEGQVEFIKALLTTIEKVSKDTEDEE